MKPVIGIVTRPEKDSDDFHVQCVYKHYIDAIIEFGGIPIGLLPPQDVLYYDESPSQIASLTDNEKKVIERQFDLCDGIIFQGGDKWYEYDEYFLELAIKKDIPFLGICLGMQIINKYISNSERVTDKTVKIESEINHRQTNVKYAHEVKLNKGSKLYDIYGKQDIIVNSHHNYRVIENKDLAVGYSPDGIVEAIEVPDVSYGIGVQWHPERMYKYDEDTRSLFKSFILASSKKMERNKNSHDKNEVQTNDDVII